VPSEAPHACAPLQWPTAAPFDVLPRVSYQTPISPGVLLEAPPSEFPEGVPPEALLVHIFREPAEVPHSQSCAPIERRHSQSCAPTDGPFEFSNSSVPPEAPPAQFWAPAREPSESPSSSSSEASPTLYTAPSEAPLRYLVPAVSPSTASPDVSAPRHSLSHN
jgi:hypothetical protein